MASPVDKKRRLEEEEDGTVPTKAEIKELVTVLTKDQLIDLLADAAAESRWVLEHVREIANKDLANRKLFVRGLSWETNTEMLLGFFRQYGEIEEGTVIVDKQTGKSKGFGFVTFASMESAKRAIAASDKTLDGRTIHCNLAAAGEKSSSSAGASSGAQGDLASRKIYIGGLSFETTSETLNAFFAQYGTVEEGTVITDKTTGKSRGFGFVTMKTAAEAQRALVEPNKVIDGRTAHANLAAAGAKKESVATSSVLAAPTFAPPPAVASAGAMSAYALGAYPRPAAAATPAAAAAAAAVAAGGAAAVPGYLGYTYPQAYAAPSQFGAAGATYAAQYAGYYPPQQ